MADLGFEVEFFNNLFDIGRKPRKVILHIGFKNLLVVGGCHEKIFQGPLAGIVKHIARGILKPIVIQFNQPHVVFLKGQLLQHFFLGQLQKAVTAP